MGKVFGKPSAPATPDYAAAATAQGAANKDAAIASYQLNNTNQVTPWGTKTLTQDGFQSDGTTPKYTQTTALNPQDQALLDQQRGVEGGIMGLAPAALKTAGDVLGTSLNTGNLPPMAYQVDTGGAKNLDYSQLPGQQYSVGSSDAVRQQVEDAAWGKYISRAAPLMQQQTNDLNTRLANMGGVTTSAGAMRQTGALRASQGDSVNQAIQDTILQGGNAAQQQQNMNLAGANLWNTSRATDASLLKDQTTTNNSINQQDIQNAFSNANLTNTSRSQGLNEAAQLRQMPLNELLAMLNGTQVNSPQFGQIASTNIQPTPVLQGVEDQTAANQAAYATQQSGFNSLLSALGGAGAAGITKFSDRRLKRNIVHVGQSPGGLNIYDYTIGGVRERGVMADEVLRVNPAAVSFSIDGYFMVNYGLLS